MQTETTSIETDRSLIQKDAGFKMIGCEDGTLACCHKGRSYGKQHAVSSKEIRVRATLYKEFSLLRICPKIMKSVCQNDSIHPCLLQHN